MKILMTSETYSPRIGGAEIHVENLIKQLVVLGHTVCLITNESSEKTLPSIDGLRVVRIPWKIRNIYKLTKVVWVEVKNVDVIHSHYCHRLATISCIIGFFRRVSVIVTLHGMGILNQANPSFRGRLSHATYRFLSLQLSKKIISTSEDLARFAYSFVPDAKVSIISNGFDEQVFVDEDINGIHSNLKSKFRERKVILTVRRLVPKNGIQYMVDAMPGILRINKDVQLVIIGDGFLMDSLKKKVKILDIEDHVCFEGFKGSSEVVDYLKVANVVAFPSTAESASLACVEAMAMGKIIVASKVGGLVELLGKNSERGRLVQIMDWQNSNYDAPSFLSLEKLEKLENSITIALEGTVIDKRKASLASEYALQYLSWKAITSETVQIYKKYSK